MTERCNSRFGGRAARTTLQGLKIIFISCMIALLSACVPSGEEHVNTELFKSSDDLRERASAIRPGMPKKIVFEKLGIDENRFERMSDATVQQCVYGNAQVQGTPDQLEAFKKRVMSYEGFSLPYRQISSSNSLGFGKMKVERTGYDLRLVLIFERDRLLKMAIEGTEQVRQEQDKYLWDMLLGRGLSLAF